MAVAQQPAQPAAPGAQAPLQLNSITPPKKIEFPPADPKNFTAASPTAAEVNAFLKQLWGYDPNRVWQVAAVQKTKAPNLSRVIVLVAEQGISRQPGETSFFVTPDGQHAISGNDVVDFGPHPFANTQNALVQQANGPYQGSSSKKLLLVEFADMQCPHCKEAAPTMKQVATDFPNARIVFENFPLTNVHPAAEKAAEYGVCVAKEKGNAAFFQYLQAVYDNQNSLTTTPDQTLKDAATKAGADPSTVATCAASPAAKAAVDASVKLGQDIGVNQTPTLFVNGRNIPIGGIPYATLKQIITYAAAEDNVPTTSR
jgi:protein-disulfide isomerase